MRKNKKNSFLKRLVMTLFVLAAVFFIAYHLILRWAAIPNPVISGKEGITEQEAIQQDGHIAFGNNRFRRSESGLLEMYLEGAAFERGVAAGKMNRGLLRYQEDAFVEQIKNIIPSESYLGFLRLFIGIFNRNLPANVPEEYQHEIYGISLSCTDDYNMIGTPYERQLNYHSAHDLGHAMQDYMLVGCTSFAAWGAYSADSTLLIGRNFDFYVGDKFAENKIVAFYNPDNGHKFAMVTWPGMTGVLSGMNEQGLTVTINAAKSSMPTSSATPISILCREILQYAATIDEAYAIANSKRTFVSESILIGSAKDGQAAIIEKSPDKIGLYTPGKEWLVCANHFQSDTFRDDERNIENIATSDSPYRQKRAEELIEEYMPLDPQKTAFILRNKKGLAGKDIGLGNEKAINQLIAHHSVIFAPEKRIMWVSAGPWQIGEYITYDLNTVFSNPDFSQELKIDSLTIPADVFLHSESYHDFLEYKAGTKALKQAIKEKTTLQDEWLSRYIATNPEFYYVYNLTGDYHLSQKDKEKAVQQWQTALEKEIPKEHEREEIRKKIEKNGK